MKTKKKELGQFFTDPVIASFMVDLVLENNPKTLLDPAVGMGIFTKTAYSHDNQLKLSACEIDPDMIKAFKKENDYSCRLYEQDYLNCCFDEKFDAIICNPPYNKFQMIPDREKLIGDFDSRYHIRLSGYSNLCVYFLVKSMNELNKNGKCCYIIPYEFLNTGYGTRIKRYLLDSKMLRTIIKFDNNLNLFSEAITTTCILLLENKEFSSIDFVNIKNVNELQGACFSDTKSYSYTSLSPDEKWLQYFEDSSAINGYNNIVKLSTFGKVSRGIATGSNAYFALNQSMVEKYGISKQACIPCLTKSPDVKDIVFTETSFKKLEELDKKVFLFDGKQATTEGDYAYIKHGEELGVNKAYLTSHRTPWFALEDKKPAPILVCVFNRNKLKTIRNEAMVKNLTTFHGLYLHNDDEEFSNILFCYLLTPLAQELLFLSRREYGAGLTKFEPNDLTKGYMLDLRIVEEHDNKRIIEIYSEIKNKNQETHLNELDAIFRKYVMKEEISKNLYPPEPIQLELDFSGSSYNSIS